LGQYGGALVMIENSTSGIKGLPRRPFVRNARDYYRRNNKGRERKAMSFEYVSVEEAILCYRIFQEVTVAHALFAQVPD
jgi:hypothetical protein